MRECTNRASDDHVPTPRPLDPAIDPEREYYLTRKRAKRSATKASPMSDLSNRGASQGDCPAGVNIIGPRTALSSVRVGDITVPTKRSKTEFPVKKRPQRHIQTSPNLASPEDFMASFITQAKSGVNQSEEASKSKVSQSSPKHVTDNTTKPTTVTAPTSQHSTAIADPVSEQVMDARSTEVAAQVNRSPAHPECNTVVPPVLEQRDSHPTPTKGRIGDNLFEKLLARPVDFLSSAFGNMASSQSSARPSSSDQNHVASEAAPALEAHTSTNAGPVNLLAAFMQHANTSIHAAPNSKAASILHKATAKPVPAISSRTGTNLSLIRVTEPPRSEKSLGTDGLKTPVSPSAISFGASTTEEGTPAANPGQLSTPNSGIVRERGPSNDVPARLRPGMHHLTDSGPGIENDIANCQFSNNKDASSSDSLLLSAQPESFFLSQIAESQTRIKAKRKTLDNSEQWSMKPNTSSMSVSDGPVEGVFHATGELVPWRIRYLGSRYYSQVFFDECLAVAWAYKAPPQAPSTLPETKEATPSISGHSVPSVSSSGRQFWKQKVPAEIRGTDEIREDWLDEQKEQIITFYNLSEEKYGKLSRAEKVKLAGPVQHAKVREKFAKTALGLGHSVSQLQNLSNDTKEVQSGPTQPVPGTTGHVRQRSSISELSHCVSTMAISPTQITQREGATNTYPSSTEFIDAVSDAQKGSGRAKKSENVISGLREESSALTVPAANSNTTSLPGQAETRDCLGSDVTNFPSTRDQAVKNIRDARQLSYSLAPASKGHFKKPGFDPIFGSIFEPSSENRSKHASRVVVTSGSSRSISDNQSSALKTSDPPAMPSVPEFLFNFKPPSHKRSTTSAMTNVPEWLKKEKGISTDMKPAKDEHNSFSQSGVRSQPLPKGPTTFPITSTVNHATNPNQSKFGTYEKLPVHVRQYSLKSVASSEASFHSASDNHPEPKAIAMDHISAVPDPSQETPQILSLKRSVNNGPMKNVAPWLKEQIRSSENQNLPPSQTAQQSRNRSSAPRIDAGYSSQPKSLASASFQASDTAPGDVPKMRSGNALYKATPKTSNIPAWLTGEISKTRKKDEKEVENQGLDEFPKREAKPRKVTGLAGSRFAS